MFMTIVVLLATTMAPAQVRPLLDVPYVAQTPELCGGAAVSMVMRYWGARDVIPEDFSALVVPSQRGIPAAALTEAVRTRRWRALAGPSGARDAWESLEKDLSRGRPVIALIEVRPQTFHYVVVVGLTTAEIVVHDPARSPFRVESRDAFERAWGVAGHWSVVLLPPQSGDTVEPPAATAVTPAAAGSTPCGAMVSRGVELAVAGQTADAEAVLIAASALCPAESGPWRELAGLRFTEKKWTEAARLAARAVQVSPDDDHARQVLATSRVLAGDGAGALRAWNPLGEPRVDTIVVVGAERLSHPDVIEASGLIARRLLTADMLQLASRRVSEIPSVSKVLVSYAPVDARADVTVALVERAVVPRGWVSIGTTVARALLEDQVRLDIYGAFRRGERLGGAWRWRPERRRVIVGAAFPAPAGLPGVLAFEAQWDRQTYTAAVREERRRLSLRISDWATPHLRWRVGAGTDRFDRGRYAAVELGTEVRAAGDRLAAGAGVQRWIPFDGGAHLGAFAGFAAWRSTTGTTGPVWQVTAAFDDVSRHAPRAVWPGAGTGGRGTLLRAHPLVVDDVVAGPAFGRRVVSTTGEFWLPVADVMGQRVLFAVFTDAAQAWSGTAGESTRLFIDAGLGLRVSLPGGTARLDVARGLRGGGTTWSAGWMVPWPR